MFTLSAIVSGVLLITAGGDAFLPILSFYRDMQNVGSGMPCRWYNMPAYASVITPPVSYGQVGATQGLDLNSIASMLSRLYPESSGSAAPSRPRVVVRVEETNTARNRVGVATVTNTPGNRGNRELDYYDPNGDYYYDDGEDGYDDYSDPDGYGNSDTYYDAPSANPAFARGSGNILQTWYGSGWGGTSANTNPCGVCATSALLSFLSG